MHTWAYARKYNSISYNELDRPLLWTIEYKTLKKN